MTLRVETLDRKQITADVRDVLSAIYLAYECW